MSTASLGPGLAHVGLYSGRNEPRICVQTTGVWSASPASLPTGPVPLAILRVVISLEQLGAFCVNPRPRPEFRVRRNRLPLRSVDEIARDRRSGRG